MGVLSSILSIVSAAVVTILPTMYLMTLPYFERLGVGYGNGMGVLDGVTCLSAGALLGDAFLHLINNHDHKSHKDSKDHIHLSHSHNQNHIEEVLGHGHSHGDGMTVLIGIGFFFTIEMISRIVIRRRRRLGENLGKGKKDEDGPNHGHGHGHSHGHNHDHCHSSSAIGYLGIVTDCLHNFTDGLAIAASYTSSIRLGITTTLAIFCHEIPHQLADYAILTKAGFRHEKVLKLQAWTSLAVFLGAMMGLIGGKVVGTEILLPFSAGGFVYLSLCVMLPLVLRGEKGLIEGLINVVCFALGILMMTSLNPFE